MSEPTTTNGTTAAPPLVPFLKRVRIRNYKSIASCDVELGALTLLVGRNGSGKSNFLDALGFVADALRASLGHAISFRGGLGALLHRGRERHECLSFGLEMTLRDGVDVRRADYGFSLAPRNGGWPLTNEYLKLEPRMPVDEANGFETRDGKLEWSSLNESVAPFLLSDRLYLTQWAGDSFALEVIRYLCEIHTYNLNPTSMKPPQRPAGEELLFSDGANIASVVRRITDASPEMKERLVGYLSTITPGIMDVNRVELGSDFEALRFRQTLDGSSAPTEFYASSMSDGTLRALGILVAVAQLADGENPVRLVGIEEPETALHPAAAGALMDALQEAAVRTQVVVTTHSPDLLDQIDPETDRLLAVEMRDGNTVIGPVNGASREAIQKKLFSPGELLRMDQFEPDWRDLERQRGLLDAAKESE
jgi:predicted ATPase